MFCLVLLAGLTRCKSIPVDPSAQAAEAGDYTLIMQNGCAEALPSRGADIMRVKVGAPIDCSWNILLPKGDNVLGGEINVTYGDKSLSYGVTGAVTSIGVRELVGHDFWSGEDDGLVLALATIRYKGNETEEVVRARGLLFIVVTEANYDPLPIDSGFSAFSMDCKIQYSTAGRSAVSCK